MKTCSDCGETKPLSEFHRNGTTSAGTVKRLARCRVCQAANRKRHRYEITTEEYYSLLSKQGGCCAICGEAFSDLRVTVDHNHITGAVRGLLHQKCNTAIGLLNDDPTLVRRALQYLTAKE